MSKKTQKNKMSLQELAAMRGIEKTEQAGCTFNAELVPRDYAAEKAEAAAAKKAAEEAANQARIAEKAAKKAAEAEEARMALFNKAADGVDFPLCFTNIDGADGWFIFACKEGVPFFFCHMAEDGDYLVPDMEGITFNAYKYADEFFTSSEVSLMPLDEAVELWRATGHYSRHPVMNCYGEGRGRTVIQVLNGYYPSAEPASDWHWNDRDA